MSELVFSDLPENGKVQMGHHRKFDKFDEEDVGSGFYFKDQNQEFKPELALKLEPDEDCELFKVSFSKISPWLHFSTEPWKTKIVQMKNLPSITDQRKFDWK